MHGTSTIARENLLEGATNIQSCQCRLVRLDDTISEPVGFIKIDVEGHELAVLQGAARILELERPVVLVESEKRHHLDAPQNIFNLMVARGYKGLFLQDGKPRPLSAFDTGLHQNPAALEGGVRKIGTYINNFIFLPDYDDRPELELTGCQARDRKSLILARNGMKSGKLE
jgi:hypothetical protein